MSNKIWCYKLYIGTDKLHDPESFIYRRFRKIIESRLKVATFYEAFGLWEKQFENVGVIELMTADVADRDMMTSLASELCTVLGEDSILFTGHELSDYEIIISAEKTTSRSAAASADIT